MAKWTSEELNKFGIAEEIEIKPMRGDGTLREPTTIWIVRVGDDLYVRSWRGQEGAWFGVAQTSQEGRIRAGGVEKEVSFVEVRDFDLNDEIDAAYRAKYGQYPQYVNQMVAAGSRATTLRLIPRDAGDNE